MSKRGLWSEDQLRSAMNAVNEGMSVNKASKAFCVPRRTLRDHLKTGSVIKRQGRHPYLSKDQELELCARIFRLADIGMPITGKFLRRSVFNFCMLNSITHPFDVKKRAAGRKWLRLFLQRHPEVSKRKAQNMNPGRALKLNPFIVNDHFEKLRQILLEEDLMTKPELIYNIDEKGCRLTIHHQQTVLARKGAKRLHLIAPEHAENVTIVACANAAGNRIPPMVIFKGQRMKPEWKKNMPPGTTTVMTGKGTMNTVTFITWLEHFARHKTVGKALLIFDGASSHLDANIVEAADKHGIILYCLPSNTTHELQPMDKAVFKSFESFWDDKVKLFFDRHQTTNLTKSDFGEIFEKVWSRSVTPQNIMSGFRGTGIYPFNPNVIPEVAFAPSSVSQQDNSEPTTSTPVPNSTRSSPSLPNHKSLEPTSSTTVQSSEERESPSVCDISQSSDSDDSYTTPDDPIPPGNEDRHDRSLQISFSEILSTPKKESSTTAEEEGA